MGFTTHVLPFRMDLNDLREPALVPENPPGPPVHPVAHLIYLSTDRCSDLDSARRMNVKAKRRPLGSDDVEGDRPLAVRDLVRVGRDVGTEK